MSNVGTTGSSEFPPTWLAALADELQTSEIAICIVFRGSHAAQARIRAWPAGQPAQQAVEFPAPGSISGASLECLANAIREGLKRGQMHAATDVVQVGASQPRKHPMSVTGLRRRTRALVSYRQTWLNRHRQGAASRPVGKIGSAARLEKAA